MEAKNNFYLSLLKLYYIFMGLSIVGNSCGLRKYKNKHIHNKNLIIVRHFNKELFDIISLKHAQSSEQSKHFDLQALHLTRSSVTARSTSSAYAA